MSDTSENKVPKTYSLDPELIAWVTRKAARRTIEADRRVSDSEIVNAILRDEMEADNELEASRIISPTITKVQKKSKHGQTAASVAA